MSVDVELGKRAIACKRWRWMPGMLTTCRLRVVDGGADYVIGHRSGPTRDGGGWIDETPTSRLPDLTDPATIGCFLALVREAWPDTAKPPPHNLPACTEAANARVSCSECEGRGHPLGRHGDGSNCVRCYGDGHVPSHEFIEWLCFVPGGRRFHGRTEAEALVAALEAAP